VNSSQEHQLNPGALFPRVLEAPFVTPTPSPGGAIQVSGGLRHFYLRRRLPDTGGKEKAMFARALECQAKDGNGVQIRSEVTNNMLASRQKQSGFVDFFALSDGNNDQAVYQALDFPRRY
jgi:hypothetical protein